MKTILILACTLFGFNSFGGTIELDIPKTSSPSEIAIVTLENSYLATGCSDKTVELVALQTTDNNFVVGMPLEVPIAAGLPPIFGCQADVTYTETVEFPVYGIDGRTITIDTLRRGLTASVEIRTFPVH